MEPRFLSADEQHTVVEYLMLGASAMAAVKRVGRDYEDFEHTRQHDPVFRRRCRLAKRALAGNVASALYKNAMEGSVSAQTSWLRQVRDAAADDGSSNDDHDDDLNDEEIEKLMVEKRIPVPTEVDACVGETAGEDKPAHLPAGDQPHE